MPKFEHQTEVKLTLLMRAILNSILAFLFFGLPLFVPAGTIEFWNAWIFLGIFISCFLVILIYFALENPEYVKKRFKGEEKEKQQKIIMFLLIICTYIMLAISGFNYRYRWSTVPILFVAVCSLVVTGGFILLFIAMKQNRFSSRVIEIQEGQKVIDTGMYSIVRHPMYLAFSIIFCFSPIVLGSLYSLIPAACIPFLLTFRIRYEEAVLRNGLSGYDSYAKKVKYRLIPFVW